MSAWELVALGTASQVPTRHRNHNGYFLRAGEEGLLFDPGEGTQRQMLFAGVRSVAITRIFVTHLHGDHCLGLASMVQRLSFDGVTRPVPLYHPASGAPYVERLLHASIFDDRTNLVRVPIDRDGEVARDERLVVHAARLRHRVDAVGYRVEQPPGVHLVPERLRAAGLEGPVIGRLRREGAVEVGGRRIRLEDVSEVRRGRSMAFVMDTAWCDAALELARGVDLLVCESTFLHQHAAEADAYGHLTARQAGELARAAGVRRLVLTHFSQREPDTARYVAEAAAVFSDVVGAEDGLTVPVP